jgi:hypothetical protein
MFEFLKDKKKDDPITEDLVEAIRCFLGENGIDHFTNIHTKFNTLNPVEYHGTVPHSIYSKEGMIIRNTMRDYNKGQKIVNWTDQDYDNRWEATVLRACGIESDCPMIDNRTDLW